MEAVRVIFGQIYVIGNRRVTVLGRSKEKQKNNLEIMISKELFLTIRVYSVGFPG